MIITYEDRKYEYDPGDLDIEQSLKIEKHIGGPMIDFETGVAAGKTICVQALGWLIFHGGDLDVPIASVNFKVPRLMKAFTEAADAEAAEEAAKAAPGPTAAASNGRRSARVSQPSA